MTRTVRRPGRLALDGSVWVTVSGENLAGPARMTLLRAVADLGSISRAATAVGLSYKGAWEAIESMNRLAGEALVERSIGGRGGGHTRLTEHGLRLLERFEQINAVHQRFLRVLDAEAFDLSSDFSLTRIVTMKTSARNQFVGKVTAVRMGAVSDEIEIAVPGGPRIVAIVTRDSAQSLGIRTNMTAIALVKSSSVLIATGLDGTRLSARNQFAGVVRTIQPGAVNSEVTLDLDGGGSVTAIITQDSAKSLGLKPGSRATAFFKASSVIVAVTV
ncbi:MAG TPA: TOBE domain-containing protein [Burkholderiaceae bacterium]|nr:TOBE domain-containing protein [Burkholderiaceae bacterium]